MTTRPVTAQKGLSLIELIVIFALSVTILTTSVLSLRFFQKNSNLETAVNDITSIVSTAQSNTQSGLHAQSYSIQFTSSTVELRNEANVVIKKISVPNDVEIIPPSSDIVFMKPYAKSNGGVFTVRLKDSSKSRQITISTLGNMTIQ